MKKRILAERYAKALLALGVEEKSVDRFLDEISRFDRAVKMEPNFLKLLSSREFPIAKREKILEGLMLKLYLSPYFQNFLKLLIRRERISSFPYIAEAFEGFVRQLEKRIIAKVRVADEKSAKGLVGQLKTSLEKMTAKKVDFEIQEDPSLIGGLEVTIGDKIYDASIKGELERIQEKWN